MPTPENFELSTINPIPKMPRKKFGPGNPSLGRLKGAINKVTRDIKNGVITAAENLGRDGKGAGGLVGYLEYVGVNHPKAFCHLLGKMLPMQISSDGRIGNRIGTVNIVSIPHDHYLSSEDIERLRSPGHTLEHSPATEPNTAEPSE